MKSTKSQIVVIGAGLAGLVTSIGLKKFGYEVLLIEKKAFPFHRVCGEYISKEVIPYLEYLDIMPSKFSPSDINRFELSSIAGKSKYIDLDLGGFGISRYKLDQYLFETCQNIGVNTLQDEVTSIKYDQNSFDITTKTDSIRAAIVVGAYGKRTSLDKKLDRSFFFKPSPYVGVKYHIKLDYPKDLVALHNFPGGYCGLSAIEEGKYNLCYLTHRDNVKKYRDISVMEQEVLHQNPKLKDVLSKAEFLFDRPEVINEISFETKGPIEQHMLMAGDAAGMITPLCGNGMAMAIHSAKLVSEQIHNYFDQKLSREQLEQSYTKVWNKQFKARLAIGRTVQNLFGAGFQSNFAVNLLGYKPLANFIIGKTHGKPF